MLFSLCLQAMSPRQSNIEIICNVILTLTSCGGDLLAEKHEIDMEGDKKNSYIFTPEMLINNGKSVTFSLHASTSHKENTTVQHVGFTKNTKWIDKENIFFYSEWSNLQLQSNISH